VSVPVPGRGRSRGLAVAFALVVLASGALGALAASPAAAGHVAALGSGSSSSRAGPAPPTVASACSAAAPRASPASARPSANGWNSDFFHDVQVNFGGPSLSGPLQPVPYRNTLPISTYGFWLNISSLAPLVFANVTIWGTEWANGTGLGTPITGYSPTLPAVASMIVNPKDPDLASYYFDTYRFFWPGSIVYFNVSAVGLNATPSEVKSATNDSVPISYPGGYVNDATWEFTVATPWSSGNFTDDIAISTTPNIFSASPTAPNADQSFSIAITAIDLGGTVSPIPEATLVYNLIQNGTVTSYSEPFGPVNHTVQTLVSPIGPYPGATLQFSVTAGLPWESGELDKITSPTYSVTWSSHGGWWFPTQGLLSNLGLSASPDVLVGGVSPTNPTAISTDEPVNITIHEPIENVTISSAIVDFTFSDQGVNHSGAIAMTAINDNTSYADLAGLPSGAMVTFYVVAKDINGNPVSSGNFSYTEVGPTSPPLPAGYGLVFLEVLDLNGGGLVGGFDYTVANATWSTSGVANALGFATPVIPGTGLGYRLGFGTYAVTVRAFGVVRDATVSISASSPTPTVVFYGESSPIPITSTSSLSVQSLAAAIGLAGAAVVTVPLMLWFDERRARKEAEERRITL